MASSNTISKPKGRSKPINRLNDLTAKEWIPETVSVWIQRGLGQSHAHAQIEKQHPAPFSFQDVGRLVRFFTKSGELVLDPFVGVGSTLKAAALEGRRGIGFELNAKYVALARRRLKEELAEELIACHDQRVAERPKKLLWQVYGAGLRNAIRPFGRSPRLRPTARLFFGHVRSGLTRDAA